MSDSEQKPYSGENFRGAEHASPYPVSRLGAPVSLVDSATPIQEASDAVALRTNAQLDLWRHDDPDITTRAVSMLALATPRSAATKPRRRGSTSEARPLCGVHYAHETYECRDR